MEKTIPPIKPKPKPNSLQIGGSVATSNQNCLPLDAEQVYFFIINICHLHTWAQGWGRGMGGGGGSLLTVYPPSKFLLKATPINSQNRGFLTRYIFWPLTLPQDFWPSSCMVTCRHRSKQWGEGWSGSGGIKQGPLGFFRNTC